MVFRKAAEEAEEITRGASAEELADSISARWEKTDAHTSHLETDERVKAFLQLRLTNRLVESIDRLVAASNSSTETMGRLTAVYVSLTGVLAMVGVVGLGLSIASSFENRRAEIIGATVVAGIALVTIAGLWARNLWPRSAAKADKPLNS